MCLEQRLEQMGVRVTPVRQLVYQALQDSDYAQSLSDLEAMLQTVDKSSIFRNLHLFIEVGLVHQIQDDSGIAKYALSQDAEGVLGENHAHFVCLGCEKTICLEEVDLDMSQIKLPADYTSEQFSILLKGYCDECRRKGRGKR